MSENHARKNEKRSWSAGKTDGGAGSAQEGGGANFAAKGEKKSWSEGKTAGGSGSAQEGTGKNFAVKHAPGSLAFSGAGGGTKPAGKPSGKGGSTLVAVDDVNHKIYITTKMEFSGPDATEDYAKAAKKQIEETWSGKAKRNGKDYDVVVEIETKVNTSGTPTRGYDPIRVDRSVGRMNQTLYGAGPGNQTPQAANDAARPRRIAHEYGHTLGLDDGYVDTRRGSEKKDPTKKNDIMSETWPDNAGVLPHPHQDHYDEVLKSHGW